MPRYAIGTSGYNYPEWRGSFYPDKLPSARMLQFYAEHFTTVEINYTFYRMPTAKLLAKWAAETPERFVFTLKAPRRITHDARLRNCEEATRVFCDAARTLGARLAVLLFQLPPWFKKDVAVLEAFLAHLPEGIRGAFEFRHASWQDDAVYECLRGRGIALCIADADRMTTPVIATASYGYFRLRDEGYESADITRWARTIAARSEWSDVYVYFKHEEHGKGPAFARMLMVELAEASP